MLSERTSDKTAAQALARGARDRAGSGDPKRHPLRSLLILLVAALAILAIAPFLGRPMIALRDALAGGDPMEHLLFWRWRLPRALTAFVVGAALALGGAVFQAVFRNALATPFTLGISSGASLGAALASQLMVLSAQLSVFRPEADLGVLPLQAAAFAGAMFSVALVHGISRMRRGFSTSDLLLAGVAVSFLFSSLIMLIQSIGDPGQSIRLLHWMMGGIFVTGLGDLVPLLPPVLVGTAMIAFRTRELDILLLGDDLAVSRGLDTRRLRRTLFIAVSLMVGACVAICGPIGFVGLMVPHVCRLVFGARHRVLIPASALAGGALLVVCDTLARTALNMVELPIGVITSLLGAPFFLWLLYAGRTELTNSDK